MADRIEIIGYQPTWPDEYLGIRAELLVALGTHALDIQHIGSTSVVGLAAKDIIDVQVSVAALDPTTQRPALEGIGYVWRPDITRDHRPPASNLPDSELEKRYAQRTEPRPVNCHIRIAGRFNHRYPLLFRDYLMAATPARDAYGMIKRHLADRFPLDVEAYYDIKDPVMDLIHHAAEAWASETGWREPLDRD